MRFFRCKKTDLVHHHESWWWFYWFLNHFLPFNWIKRNRKFLVHLNLKCEHCSTTSVDFTIGRYCKWSRRKCFFYRLPCVCVLPTNNGDSHIRVIHSSSFFIWKMKDERRMNNWNSNIHILRTHTRITHTLQILSRYYYTDRISVVPI